MTILSKNDVIIESVDVEDAKELLNIYAPYIEETAITFEYDVPSVEEFAGRIADIKSQYPYIKAVYEGKIVGYAYVHRYRVRKAFDWCVETSIYVDKGFKRSGVGRILYDELEKRLKTLGILDLYASIAIPIGEDPYLNNDSELFHERMGYNRVGVFHNAGKKFGRWYDLLWMEKSIGPHVNDDEKSI